MSDVCRPRAEPPSFEIAHALGGAIHTLRASLDYLAWELTVKRLGYRPAEVAEKDWLRRVAFPIFLHEREFKLPDKPMSEQAKGSAAMLQGMARKHAAHIKRLQPFHKPDHPLWVLSELDNIDKHRHAHVMRRVNRLAIQAGPKPLRIKREYLHPGGTIKDNTKVAQVRVRRPPDMCETEFQTQMNMCFERSFSLTFEQRSPAEGQDIIEVLHQLREHVGGIVNEFEPAFLA